LIWDLLFLKNKQMKNRKIFAIATWVLAALFVFINNASAALTVAEFSPEDGAVDVSIDTNLTMTFSEGVSTNSGNIEIKKASDDSTVETISVSPSYDYRGVASNLNGTRWIVANNAGSSLYVSSDSGDSWSEVSPQDGLSWTCVAISDDGSKMAAGVNDGYIYTSTDGGVNWTVRHPAGEGVTKSWQSIAFDNDGSILIAGAWQDKVYISENSGATWEESLPNGGSGDNWNAVSSNSDGSVLLAASSSNSAGAYVSYNKGSSWTLLSPSPPDSSDFSWSSVDLDDDGSTIAIGTVSNTGGGVYVSSNGGSSWSFFDPTPEGESWYVAVNNDGSRILANGSIGSFVSTNGGESWSSDLYGGWWNGCALSHNGSILAIFSSDVYFSSDEGETWERQIIGSTVTVDGSLVTVNPGSDLSGGTDYYVQIDAETFYTGSFEFYAGISDKTTWNFRTAGESSEGEEDDLDSNEDEDELNSAKIKSWKAYKHVDYNGNCKEKLKLTIKGKHFDKDVEVRIANKEASSISKKSSREIVAKFCLTKLLETKTDHKRKIYVTNPNTDTEEADKKIDLDNIFFGSSDLGSLSNGMLFDSRTTEGTKNIQRKLSQMGYLNSQYITGIYGPITTEAVKKFQVDNGIMQNGFMGPLTNAKLKGK
jgi:hypothetical protein